MVMTKKRVIKRKTSPVDRVKNELKKDLGKITLMLMKRRKQKLKPYELSDLYEKVNNINDDACITNGKLMEAIEEEDKDGK